MFLFVGLGNIGKEYENTRHNFGFMAVDEVIDKYSISKSSQLKFKAEIFDCLINKEKVLVIKPQTFMNNSGVAVSQVKNFYKIPIENIFVFHDDLDLEFCKLRFKQGGGDGGHNGIKSIDSMIGKNYYRIRMGIGRPQNSEDVANYVLGKFSANNLENIDFLLKKVSFNISELFSENKSNFLSKINL